MNFLYRLAVVAVAIVAMSVLAAMAWENSDPPPPAATTAPAPR